MGKLFPNEKELQEKSDRLVELDTLLNIDSGRKESEQSVAKGVRASVLENLKRPAQHGAVEKKQKCYEEVR